MTESSSSGGNRFWRRGILALSAAAVLGAAVGIAPSVMAQAFDPPNPKDVASPPGTIGTPGALTEIRKCAAIDGTTNYVFITLAPSDTPVSKTAGPIVAANLPCGPEDRIR